MRVGPVSNPTRRNDFLLGGGVESQIANVMAGPFAAVLDWARDAIVGKG
ncbi:hypothetical protein MGAST_02140 [Mycobacterium gastri 'Wayne']|nr:hypothetical protein MGAST_02140 [Mycobacterium gastri 'Wayne']